MEVSLKRQFSYGSFTTERFLKIIRRNGWSFSKDCLYYQLCLVLCSSSFFGCKACSSFPLMYKQVWEGLVNISYYFMVLSASHLFQFHFALFLSSWVIFLWFPFFNVLQTNLHRLAWPPQMQQIHKGGPLWSTAKGNPLLFMLTCVPQPCPLTAGTRSGGVLPQADQPPFRRLRNENAPDVVAWIWRVLPEN